MCWVYREWRVDQIRYELEVGLSSNGSRPCRTRLGSLNITWQQCKTISAFWWMRKLNGMILQELCKGWKIMSHGWKLESTLLTTNNLHSSVKIMYWCFLPRSLQESKPKWKVKTDSFRVLDPRSQWCGFNLEKPPENINLGYFTILTRTCKHLQQGSGDVFIREALPWSY